MDNVFWLSSSTSLHKIIGQCIVYTVFYSHSVFYGISVLYSVDRTILNLVYLKGIVGCMIYPLCRVVCSVSEDPKCGTQLL